MTTRIFIDVRGEGAQIADQLSLLGFEVLPFYPVRGNKLTCGFYPVVRLPSAQTDKPLLVEFPSDSPLFGSSHDSLKGANDRPECAEVVRLWKLWQRCPQCSQDGKTNTSISCASPMCTL